MTATRFVAITGASTRGAGAGIGRTTALRLAPDDGIHAAGGVAAPPRDPF